VEGGTAQAPLLPTREANNKPIEAMCRKSVFMLIQLLVSEETVRHAVIIVRY
jgi:hypothetical protein